MISPQVEQILSDCDRLNVRLCLGATGGIRCLVDGGSIGDDLREKITANRSDVLAVLKSSTVTEPDPILFVSRNLDLRTLDPECSRYSTGVHFGNRPFWQLTPRVYWAILRLCDQHFRQPDGLFPAENPVYRQALDFTDQMRRYVESHFRPDQIDRAFRLAEPLPSVRPKANL